ncbi:DUF1097 domain-containing protein [Caproicibacter sp. BJN0012]|uniref:DUF1097 domain-containing protein n=1 Tax=Caproicibacter sp. BJN0012 TaxID=3110227 RepID=UPI002E0FAE75
MNKATWLYSLWVSVMCAIFFFLYGYTGLSIGWMSFVVLAVYFGMGSKLKDVPACFCSIAAGLIWGQLNFLFIRFESSIGIPSAATMFIGITVMTTITMGLHLTVLGKTLFNRLPFIFAAVALTFSQNGGNELGLACTLMGGLLLAGVCSLGESFIFAHYSKPKPEDTSEDSEGGKEAANIP